MSNKKEIIVADVNVLHDGEMKKIEVDGHEILLSRIDGNYYAVSASCPHYSASLDEGILSGDRLYCPWHHACFDARTGDLQEPPAQNALARFEVRIDGDKVLLKLPEKITKKRVPEMAGHDAEADDRTFVVLGAGAAGNMAAQTLREDGFQGRIIMISREEHLPYDRPNLSKSYLQGKADREWMPLRSQNFYEEHDIELMLGKKVTSVKPNSKSVSFENGDSLQYDKLLLATGAIPRTLNVPGAQLKNIYTLRSWDDADMIIRAAERAERVAVVGASFIGMEVADSLAKRKLPVTVIAPESVPFERAFGREIGSMFQNLHVENGINFRLGSKIERFEGGGTVKSLTLGGGERIEADVVVIGIGVTPATDNLEGVNLLTDGSVKVDEYLQVQRDIYAAGDIVTFKDMRTGEDIRIEHWRTAEQQGRHAAHTMVGMKKSYTSIPFFWTNQAGLSFRYVGYAKTWDEIVIQGSVQERKFLAYFVKNDHVHAVAGNKRDRDIAAAEELMCRGEMPSVAAVRQGDVDLVSLID